ncbi:putative ABC transporter [Xylona heveae TC161]|uniref:Putative ABC transporter n=1 Tax=Xylona heveae (strain CBS 132557 / TC161) TaxID=1328760 RepID=A0A165IZE6_XYLHT|nr:putative ABC transporter [Xylona heveae TC161]KZF25583.1 putative ABC transporter [Xylona heveae TC161]
MPAPPVISATCKQTRFHLLDDKPSNEVDVQGLSILIGSADQNSNDISSNEAASTKTKDKIKAKLKSKGRELVTDAHLRLKGGRHYGLVGRNGTGKSTILRAMSEKIIPGIPYSTRIAILQQIGDEDQSGHTRPAKSGIENEDMTVLQKVMQSDEAKNNLSQKIDILSAAFEDTDDTFNPIRASRQLKHEELETQLCLAQKNASLRSGSRGLQARKELLAMEAKITASADLLCQSKDDLDPSMFQQETQAAVDLLSDMQSHFEAIRIPDIEREAHNVLRGLGFSEDDFSKSYSTLSGGWRMRATLAGILIQNPEIMILDEPTNYLDLLGVIWLETYLKRLRESSETTLILVSHDRAFMDAVCEETIILRDQDLTYFRGNVSAYENDRKSQQLYWARMQEAQDRQTAHMQDTIRDTMKQGKKTGDDSKLRMAKSRQRKLDERMGIEVNAKGGRFKLNRDLAGWHSTRRDAIEIPADEKAVVMSFPDPDLTELRFPGPLISMEQITFGYPSGSRGLKRAGTGSGMSASSTTTVPVLNEINFSIYPGDRLGIMGLNGSGKSTLLKLLVGQEKLLNGRGTISTHPRLKLGYFSQHSAESLRATGIAEPELSALALMMREVGGTMAQGEVRALLGSMGLPGRIASDVPVRLLSGGQLSRLALSVTLYPRPHLLILDEPSTHLDLDTVHALASALVSFSGAILLVSHDRYLVRRVVEGKVRGIQKNSDDEDYEEEDDGDDDDDESSKRWGVACKRAVYVLRKGKLVEQERGVEQFETSLEKRVNKISYST